jgi:hypothetical protein
MPVQLNRAISLYMGTASLPWARILAITSAYLVRYSIVYLMGSTQAVVFAL